MKESLIAKINEYYPKAPSLFLAAARFFEENKTSDAHIKVRHLKSVPELQTDIRIEFDKYGFLIDKSIEFETKIFTKREFLTLICG